MSSHGLREAKSQTSALATMNVYLSLTLILSLTVQPRSRQQRHKATGILANPNAAGTSSIY